jgi:hypothetical protein
MAPRDAQATHTPEDAGAGVVPRVTPACAVAMAASM